MGTPNWSNRTLWTGDNLDIMRGMNSETVDLIYLDPPFNSNKNYSAPIGSEAAGAAFKDTWSLSDVDEAWHGEVADREPTVYAAIDAAGLTHGKGMKSYLIMMAVRLLEMRRLLKPTGSIYLHCDPTASHYLKTLMDAVFGQGNFRNEIIWAYRRYTARSNRFQREHDAILLYGRSSPVFNVTYEPYGEKSGKRDSHYKQDETGKWFRWQKRKGQEPYRVYLSDGRRIGDVWQISHINASAKERVGYPTQKPLALLERIIKASSNEGDIVLDPFCGCATALVASDRLQRQWIGIDLSPLAAKLVLKRLRDDRGPLFDDVKHREDIPSRTDQGDLASYKTHRHTLYGRQEGVCGGCQIMFPFRNMTVDHVVPQSRGGSDHLDNLQLLCGACNSAKGVRSQEAFIAKLKAHGLRQ